GKGVAVGVGVGAGWRTLTCTAATRVTNLPAFARTGMKAFAVTWCGPSGSDDGSHMTSLGGLDAR
ncbi:MAG TPA: hypothetical protein VIX12_02055, partial [Candidatus Binataceae bacterium]